MSRKGQKIIAQESVGLCREAVDLKPLRGKSDTWVRTFPASTDPRQSVDRAAVFRLAIDG